MKRLIKALFVAMTLVSVSYTHLDVYKRQELFHFHESPNPNCPVGRNIHTLLDQKLYSIQTVMENEMKKYTLADLKTELKDLLQKQN